MSRVLKIIGPGLSILGACAFVVNLLLGSGLLSPAIELPLFDVQQVKCHGDRIYVALGYYSRIQVYDLGGAMVDVLDAGNFSKPYSFWIDEHGLPVIRVRGLVREEELPDVFLDGGRYVIDAPCDVEIEQSVLYLIVGGPFYPWGVALLGLLLTMIFNSRDVARFFSRMNPSKLPTGPTR